MEKIIFEGEVAPNSEDCGSALIAEINNDEEIGMYVRLISWDEYKQHTQMTPLIGKRVRITIEIIE